MFDKLARPSKLPCQLQKLKSDADSSDLQVPHPLSARGGYQCSTSALCATKCARVWSETPAVVHALLMPKT